MDDYVFEAMAILRANAKLNDKIAKRSCWCVNCFRVASNELLNAMFEAGL